MQKLPASTFSAAQKDVLLNQVKIIVDAGEITHRTDSDRAIRYTSRVRRSSHQLRLDDWKRLGRDQMGQKCGRGWQGLRGACKRVPKGGDKEAAIKASKVALADKIRKRKGLTDRNAPKVQAVPKKTRAINAKPKKMSAVDTTRAEISSLTKTDVGKSIITAIAEHSGSNGLGGSSTGVLTGYPWMHFEEGNTGIEIDREVEKTIRKLRNDIYPDLEDSQILKRLKKTVTAEDKRRLVKNKLVYKLGLSEEQAESRMSEISRTDSAQQTSRVRRLNR